jgi:hypothetical protein
MLDLQLGCLNRSNLKFTPYSSLIPNVAILGAQKAATSSLALYLSCHPDVHVCRPFKEPGFFVFDEWAKDHWTSKGQHFRSRTDLLRRTMLDGYSGQRYFVDATTRYTLGSSQRRWNIAARMKAAGVAKAVYIARNPLGRIVSAFNHMFPGGAGAPPIDEYLAVDTHLLDTSCYNEQIQPYCEQLGSESIRLLVFEQFIADPQSGMEQVYQLLNLDPAVPSNGYPKMNVTKNKVPFQFPRATYDALMQRLTPDVENFTRLLGFDPAWDLSPERWVRPGS